LCFSFFFWAAAAYTAVGAGIKRHAVTSGSSPPSERHVAGAGAPDATQTSKTKASSTASQLPPHIEETVRAISRLHTEHHQRATFSDHLVDRATSLFGRPAFIVVLSLGVVLWVGGNLVLSNTIHVALDAPPFPWLQNGLTLMALYMGALILTTQRRADSLGELREQMTLEVAILTEQKAAKLIGLIEELRRDSPEIKDRVDHEARDMASSADPHVVLEAIKETNQDMVAAAAPEPRGRPD
jgi:uncharacterized membrane protein